MSMKKVLIVDDSTFNLNMCKNSLKDLYELYFAPSAELMFKILKQIKPDLILLDVKMPGIHGYEAMRMLKADNEYKDIPVIFLTAMDDEDSEMEGFELGAMDYIHKPFVKSLLIKRINAQIAENEMKSELSALKKFTADCVKSEKSVKNNLQTSLNKVTEMIETSITSDDINKIKEHLIKTKEEIQSIHKFIDNIKET
jgi:DNA-binding response OmpR family regulator